MALLSKILVTASSSDMKRQNKRSQGFLHVLLDMNENDKYVITQETEILQSVRELLVHGVDVNVVDVQGFTPLDIAIANRENAPTLYQMCAELLVNEGAVRGNNSSSLQFGLGQHMANLCVQNEKRNLRSCPKRHVDRSKRLTEQHDSEIVSVVGKYRYFNQEPIGSGAFSNVFVAIKDENYQSGKVECRAYALKRMVKAEIDPQEFKREITTLLYISGKCENIIKCHESFQDTFFQYLCLDLMDGDLHQFITNNRVNTVMRKNPEVVMQVCKGIVNGLAYLHENNYIHRDIKPGNILYTTEPTLQFIRDRRLWSH